MEDKKLIAFAVLVLFGGNITGIVNSVSPDFRADPFTGREGRELQRQIDEIRADDTELRELVQKYIDDYNNHIKWGREVRSDNEGALQRHEAQIQELYRRIK